MELGVALIKTLFVKKNTEKCQILKNNDKFSTFLCWICFLTKAVSTQYTTVLFPKSPIRILRDVQGSGCDCSCGTHGSSVPLHTGVQLGSSAPQNAPLHLWIHTRSKIRWSSGRPKAAARGNGRDTFSLLAKAQLQLWLIQWGEVNSEQRSSWVSGALPVTAWEWKQTRFWRFQRKSQSVPFPKGSGTVPPRQPWDALIWRPGPLVPQLCMQELCSSCFIYGERLSAQPSGAQPH